MAAVVLLTCYAAGSYLASRAQSLPDLDRLIEQNVEQSAQESVERITDRVRQSASEEVAGAAAERVFRQAGQASEAAAERARQQGVFRVNDQADERMRRRVEAGSQSPSSLESVRGRLEDTIREQTNVTEELGRQVDDAVSATASSSEVSRGETSLQSREGLQSGMAAGLLPPLPDRLEIGGPGGSPVYVEVEIAPGVRAIEREWIILVNPEQRQQLFIDAPQLIPFLTGSTEFGVLDSEILTFEIPPDLDANNAVLELLPENLRPLMDRNHVYQVQGQSPEGLQGVSGESRSTSAGQAFSLITPMSAVCEQPVAIGMIDSALHTGHAVFQGLISERIRTQRFLAPELISPVNHGTAVASVLIGNDPALGPLLPNATVYSATAVHGQDRYRQGATALNLMRAISWLIEEGVSVINISLTGPSNQVLEQVLNMAIANNVAIIAAAGNHGAHSPPVYPAAYPGVVAVTAVDRRGEIYRWANQGEHVAFAALGVDLPVARSDGTIGTQSGTSLAAPVVAAYFACAIAQSPGDLHSAYQQIQTLSIDRGEPGRDSVFGFGVLHPGNTIRN